MNCIDLEQITRLIKLFKCENGKQYRPLTYPLCHEQGASAEALLGASLRQFQLRRALPQLTARAEALEAERDAVTVQGEEQVELYLELLAQWVALAAALRSSIHTPDRLLKFLQPGRLVRMRQEASDAAAPLPPLDGGDGGGDGGANSASTSGGNGAAVMQRVNRWVWRMLFCQKGVKHHTRLVVITF